MKLQDLPAELLSEVFSYFRLDKQCLRDLALQCRRFSLAIRRELCREVILNLHESHSLLRLDLLNRSLGENPGLCGGLRFLSLDMLKVEDKSSVHEAVERLLVQLPALRRLKIQDNSEWPPFKHSFSQANRMKHVTYLTINDGNLKLQTMAHYMFLDNVSHLNILWLRQQDFSSSRSPVSGEADWSIVRPPSNRIAGSSPVKFLDLGPVFRLPEPILKEILSWPKALQHFRGNIPGITIPGRFGVSKISSTVLSPQSILRALYPTKHSLKCLELIDIGCQWPGHDGTEMDLSDFELLTKIDVPSTCFFKKYTYGVQKDGMYALLPRSLVELQIIYDDDCIRPGKEERIHVNEYTAQGEISQTARSSQIVSDLGSLSLESPRDLYWLLELAKNKESHFPKMKKVSLMERCGSLRPGSHPINWYLPLAIADAYHDAGIHFRAVMRNTSVAPTLN